MQAGELFISLGLKNVDKTVKDVQKVGSSLGGLSTSALAIKASIAGIMYGLEQLMSSSTTMGLGLQKFGALTGLSTDSLQQWQYAALQAGVGADEFTGSLKGVAEVVAKMQLGQGRPQGMWALENYTKNFDASKMKDTFYMMTKLQELAQRPEMEGAKGNQYLKSFGLSEGTISAMRMNTFNAANFNKSKPFVYSPEEIKSLTEVGVAWSNIKLSFETVIGKMVALEGKPFMNSIKEAADAFAYLIKEMINFNKETEVIQTIGDSFKGWASILKLIADNFKLIADIIKYIAGETLFGPLHTLSELMDKYGSTVSGTLNNYSEKYSPFVNIPSNEEIQKNPIKAPVTAIADMGVRITGSLTSLLLNILDKMPWLTTKTAQSELNTVRGSISGMSPFDVLSDKARDFFDAQYLRQFPPGERKSSLEKGLDIYSGPHAQSSSNKQQVINNKIDLHFQHDGKDALKTGESVKKAIQNAHWQTMQKQVN